MEEWVERRTFSILLPAISLSFRKVVFLKKKRAKGKMTYHFSCVLRLKNANSMTPYFSPILAFCVIPRFLAKSTAFKKNALNVFSNKIAD